MASSEKAPVWQAVFSRELAGFGKAVKPTELRVNAFNRIVGDFEPIRLFAVGGGAGLLEIQLRLVARPLKQSIFLAQDFGETCSKKTLLNCCAAPVSLSASV